MFHLIRHYIRRLFLGPVIHWRKQPWRGEENQHPSSSNRLERAISGAEKPPLDSLHPSMSLLRSADPDQPVSEVRTMADIVDQDTAGRSVQVRALGAFAAVAFLLAAVGIHGLLSFAVSQSAREIGVRIALGAQSGDILKMVLRQAALLAAAGLIPGIALAYASGRAIEARLVGVKPSDPATFLSAGALCGLMATLGVLSPALRALRTEPISAIRAE